MTRFGLKKIAQSISKNKFHRSIKTDVVYNVIKILISELSYSLVNDFTVTVKNFGTLSQWLVRGHKAGFWSEGLHNTKDTKRIRFYVHAGFSKLIQARRSRYEEKEIKDLD